MKKRLIQNGNKIDLKVTLSKKDICRIKEGKSWFSLNVVRRPEMVTGLTSMCEDGKHILMIDYDNICKWIVEQDLKKIGDKHRISFYIFTTKEEKIDGDVVGNYHVISLAKFTPSEIFEIQSGTHCDSNYKSMPIRNPFRAWVLRISEKGKRSRPKFIHPFYTYIGDDKEISEAHLIFLNKLYNNLPEIEYSKKDGLKNIFMNHYETVNRT